MEQFERYLDEKIQTQTHKAMMSDLSKAVINNSNPRKQMILLGLMCIVLGVHALNDKKTTELTRETLKSYSNLL